MKDDFYRRPTPKQFRAMKEVELSGYQQVVCRALTNLKERHQFLPSEYRDTLHRHMRECEDFVRHLQDERLKHLKNQIPEEGIFAKLFGGTKIHSESRSAIESIAEKISKYESVISQDRNLLWEEDRALKELKFHESSLESIEARRQILKRKLEKEELARQKKKELQIKAAQNDKERRRLANLIKRYDLKNSECPYCGVPLKDEKHADHIYPVSKGGQSTVANMVLVCPECNIKKSDSTLREFILRHDLDRDAVEERLSRLHKAF